MKWGNMGGLQKVGALASTVKDMSDVYHNRENRGSFENYMEKMDEMKEKKLKGRALEEVANIFEKDGVDGLMNLYKENPDNEYISGGIKEYVGLQKTMKSIEEEGDTSLFKLPPKSKGGFMGMGGMSDQTLEKMKNMSTVEDLEDLYENYEKYEKEGVDVQKVLDWYMDEE